MTVPLSANSARLVGAQRFAVALRHAMKRNKVGAVRLSRAVHVSASAIGQYRMGNNVPTVEVATRLAEVLSEPRLVVLAREARTVSCDLPSCGRRFHVEAGSPRRYCTPACRMVASKKRPQDPAVTKERAVAAERALRTSQDAIALMCASCEPSGLCQTAECPLRIVSPLPLVTVSSRDVDIIPPRKQPDLGALRVAMARRWTPEARARQAEVMNARHAAMTPEERAAFGAAVSVGRRRRAA